ncbi:tetratricopeptide repeat protein [Flammeovirgaceae bacterium SG7u.111]|nr:tetratricopeptide repeat protein [Flammeovirgaceae bacterium SG7u.132]WPO33402.1 tetratricopeptide repeat protein [Flammeovirgaceae bacterium SG7u.111]
MEIKKLNPQSNYYTLVNKLGRFITREDERGYCFVTTSDQRVTPGVNQLLLERSKSKGKNTKVVHIDKKSDIEVVQQMRNARDEQPKATALIVQNINDFILKDKEALTQKGSDFLLTLNFSREAINQLNIPIIFWTTEDTLRIISNRANDLFSQRRMLTVHFESHPDDFLPDETLENRFQESYKSREEYTHLETKVKLLKKQLHQAEKDNYPPQKLFTELALPLAQIYSEIDLHQDAILTIEKYKVEVDKNKDAYLIYQIGKIYGEAKKYEKAIKLLEDATNTTIHDPFLASYIFFELGKLYQELGKFDKALDFFEKDLQLTEELFKDNPHSESLKNGLANSFGMTGDLLLQMGKVQEGLEQIQKATSLFEELFKDNPHSESLKDGLAISYEKLGDIFKAQGKFDKALDFFEKETVLFEELFKDNPHSESLKDGLAISYAKLGDIFKAQGKFDKALDFFEKQSRLSEELFKNNPHSENLKNGLAISYAKLGDIFKAQGKFDKALDFFEKRSRLSEELFKDNPNSESLKNGLANSFGMTGDLLLQMGKVQEGLEQIQKATSLFEELFKDNPHSESLKDGLAISYAKLGDIFKAHGKFDKALDFFEKDLQLTEELFKDNPHSESLKNGLAISYAKLGMVYLQIDQVNNAYNHIKKYKSISYELYKHNNSNIQIVSNYAEALSTELGMQLLINRDIDIQKLNEPTDMFQRLFDKTQSPYYQKKVALVQQMADSNSKENLKKIIIEILSF